MKTVIVSGDLTHGQLKYHPLRREFQFNNWFIKLNSVAFKTTLLFEEAITITCNFSTNENYSSGSSSVVNYEQPLQMFYVRVGANGKTVYRFIDDTWAHVNSSSSELQFSFLDFEGQLIQKTTVACRLCFTIEQR
ncbi:MAG: hypothetical protein FJ333_10185 [Sphingomonadales bacterium]|nr:hypothetical protein [Sphingomonadales bacterium]